MVIPSHCYGCSSNQMKMWCLRAREFESHLCQSFFIFLTFFFVFCFLFFFFTCFFFQSLFNCWVKYMIFSHSLVSLCINVSVYSLNKFNIYLSRRDPKAFMKRSKNQRTEVEAKSGGSIRCRSPENLTFRGITYVIYGGLTVPSSITDQS